MRKKIKAHEERNIQTAGAADPANPVPQYLLDRSAPTVAKPASSSAIKERRKEKAARFSVPLPKVRGISEEEMFRVVKTGKSKQKGWKRLLTKPTFVGPDFTRRPVKYERFIRYGLPSPPCFFVSLADEYHLVLWVCVTRKPTSPTLLLGVTVLLPHSQREEEPPGFALHPAGCPNQGRGHRGQRQRAGSHNSLWQGCLGENGLRSQVCIQRRGYPSGSGC